MPKKPGSSETSKPQAMRKIPGANRLRAGSSAPSFADLAPSKALPASGPKSLMKTSQLGTGRSAQRRPGSPPKPVTAPRRRASSAVSDGRQQKIEERLAAATEELSGGITEAASAAEELRRSMEQIASGAEEAASAAQETLAVAANTTVALVQARERSEAARRRTE